MVWEKIELHEMEVPFSILLYNFHFLNGTSDKLFM